MITERGGSKDAGRPRAIIEAETVLILRDIREVDKKLQDVSDRYYRALNRAEIDKIQREFLFYQEKKVELQAEKQKLEENLD